MKYLECSALISAGGKYRYSLTRVWDAARPKLAFCMLNPSTADGADDDPTIRRCVRFAAGFGYGGIIVANLYPWRATKTRDLVAAHRAGEDVAHRAYRDEHIRDVLRQTDHAPMVAAWGAHPMATQEWRNIPAVAWKCLGTTRSGAPRHPLYLRADAQLRAWPEETS